jgi:bisphosphoglycerate-independent phosphoglycerate mutase (AlkP superfamily)
MIGESRILKTPKVATYDLQPEMTSPMLCSRTGKAAK